MRVVVCGAGGMLATDLMSELNKMHEVSGLSIEDLDITDLPRVMDKLTGLKPEVVINAAAYTNVDGCEENPDLAYRVNALGPRNLAIASEKVGASLVQISTDYVFNGQGTRPYREYDPVDPQSVYGKSKLDGELLVRHHCSRHYIVRTAWLFGNYGNNFVRTMLKLAKEKDVLTVVNDQFGSPTYTGDLAKGICELIASQAYGTYHLTNSNSCSWYEFAKEIFAQAGLESVIVEPITTEQLNRPAKRPNYSIMDNYIWRMDGRTVLRDFRDALKDYLRVELS